ncbi:hypothetical protein KIH31_08035 [Paenarthrobacter sp. DKR-5]|uniref:hypothetical protein n=1 Tax=Paenarthrobacter sp. DKR-5 TaxID=2835535 RepID=UPI001BDC3D63|nr:hypothetical protein [Paenarthrobacter sp. DKR-5]MBT1002552.1 hypothetical protein [Paenarthrobacter sp. DKR-5]
MFRKGACVPNDYDNQLIESVAVRRGRLTTALLYGSNPLQRRWQDSVRLFLFSVAVAALIAAVCVGYSFISNLLAQQHQQQQRSPSSLEQTHRPGEDPLSAARTGA